MSQTTPNLRTSLALGAAAALVVAGVVFRQEKEMRWLRTAVAELPNHRSDGAAATSTLPADIEEQRREAAEVQRLRAEVAQLRRETVEKSAALQAGIDKLTVEVAAVTAYINRRTGPANASSLVSEAAQSSPEEAARTVAAMSAGKEQNLAALDVIHRWVRSDPAAAATWTTQFAEGPLREEAMTLVARQWGIRDWTATAGWLETLPMGSSRDAAIGAFVASADGYDIKLALEWANRTEDPDGRAQRVAETAQRWLREDNSAARAWIGKAQLPAGLAERLLSGNR